VTVEEAAEKAVFPDGERVSGAVGPIRMVFLARALASDGGDT